ncbi:MAG: Glutamate--tRNA ligase [Steroidobacteraceae bacterium]|nr:Glutamate--tRNA ligase [Steroidobacteraceae bacterium]
MPDPVPVTRFAPSPTGALHLGNARTALFSWLYARQAGGRFLLRIEDTDAGRSTESYLDALVDDLRWLGLDWQEGPDVGGPAAPYRQSERTALYADFEERLRVTGAAYPCYCTPAELELSRKAMLSAGKPPRYAGTCRELTAAQRRDREARGLAPTLRFRVQPGATVAFDDFVFGAQRFATDDIGDFIVRRADGSAAFFFCNAVDDALMGVTHVLRGEDHLTNTPRQILVLGSLGLPVPAYGHVSLIVGDDGTPLSKRHGAMSVAELRARGYLATAVRNLLFRLGHSTSARGLLAPDAMAAAFDRRHLGRSPSRFDIAQLDVWQREAVHALSDDAFEAWAGAALPANRGAAERAAFIAAVRPNVVFPDEVRAWAEVVFGAPPPLSDAAEAVVRDAGGAFFDAAAAAAAASDNDLATIAAAAREATGRKGPALYKPLRLALTGLDHGPELAPLLRAMPHDAPHDRLIRYAR